ncbi:MAG: hypothetical protein ACRDQH_01380 [Pseudonocardiaceae bacterium]
MTTAIDTITPDIATRTLAERQATGLRKLADFIEINPRFAPPEYYLSNVWTWHIIDIPGNAEHLADLIRTAHDQEATIEYQDGHGSPDAINIRIGFSDALSATILTYRSLLAQPITEPPAETETTEAKDAEDGVEIGVTA